MRIIVLLEQNYLIYLFETFWYCGSGYLLHTPPRPLVGGVITILIGFIWCYHWYNIYKYKIKNNTSHNELRIYIDAADTLADSRVALMCRIPLPILCRTL